jgi:hypothetical protein
MTAWSRTVRCAGALSCLVAICVVVLSACTSSSENSGGGGGGGGAGGGGTSGGGGTPSQSTSPPPATYSALVDPSVLTCPPIDTEFRSNRPDLWRVCAVPDGTAGTLINLSDDVEVFAAPTDVVITATRADQSSAGPLVLSVLTALAQQVSSGTVTDPAIPSGFRFVYALPGDRVVFSGGPNESLSRTTASTSLLATTDAAVARTLATAADDAVSSGTFQPSSTPAQFLLSLSNPISQCAHDALDILNSPDSATATLTDVVKSAIDGRKACTSAIALFTVSADEAALRRETESTLAFRFRTIGRHALEDTDFLKDLGKLVFTGLGRAH